VRRSRRFATGATISAQSAKSPAKQESALKIGTRGSQLALWQARTVAGLLERAGTPVELVIIKTSGDRLQEAPLSEVGGKRLFVKEIEDALLGGEIDLAVHSAKDMPAVLPEGLDVAATLQRADPRDVLILPQGKPRADIADVVATLGTAPAIGTSSVRRVAQLASLIPRATFGPIRGNVDTRLRKLDGGTFDALVLAAAGLRRLGFGERISAEIPVQHCIPAPGQGIVAIEIRADDRQTRAALRVLNDEAAFVSLVAERTVVAALGGGCQLPLGAVAVHDDDALDVHGIVASVDGQRTVKRHFRGSASDPRNAGKRLADALAEGGATDILDEVRRTQGC
jgi:hydroxymethylbilane synthase